ncbi:tripartite tricarboxylate transporter substrate binding protein [Rhodovarius crocodyli]|nr:tripartite tricarboxylate transporter substrate binding protein [Rhodovarius crocodyli]
MIVNFSAGGSTDLMARIIQPEFAAALGTTMVIKNTSGANGTVGAMEMTRAARDGNTILMTPGGSLVLTPHTRGAPFRNADFAPVCQVVNAPIIMLTTQESGIRTLNDVLARARAERGAFALANTGPGSTPHISSISLERLTGVEFNHIPFRGSGDVVQALAAGQIQLFTDQASLIQQYNYHPIAVYAERRMAEFPNTPTMRELGYDLSFSIWSGFYAPAGTPEPILDRLDAACARMVQSRAVVDGLGRLNMPIEYRNRADFTAFHNAEYARYEQMVRQFNLRVN